MDNAIHPPLVKKYVNAPIRSSRKTQFASRKPQISALKATVEPAVKNTSTPARTAGDSWECSHTTDTSVAASALWAVTVTEAKARPGNGPGT